MIDLHSHILPGIDDGARSLEDSLTMARMAVEDGTKILACTPHLAPPKYVNSGPDIRRAVSQLQAQLDEHSIALKLIAGADLHIASDLENSLKTGHALTLADTSYFLLEPPHDVLPPMLVQFAQKLKRAGYNPILTHPERLQWIEGNYNVITELADAGIVIQLTGASVTGLFGKRIQYWCERMLDEGIVDILASDAHDTKYRTTGLSKARDAVAQRLGEKEARMMVLDRPYHIVKNEALPPKPPRKPSTQAPERKSSGSRSLNPFARWAKKAAK